MKLKYAWDMSAERTLSEDELKTADRICGMVTEGCKVKSVKRNMMRLQCAP